MENNSNVSYDRTLLLKEAFDLFCRLSDNQLEEILKLIKEDNNNEE